MKNKKLKIPLIILLNKIDLVTKEKVLIEIENWKNKFSDAVILPISALNRFNINEIINSMVELLPFSPPYYSKDEVTDKSERFFVEEIIKKNLKALQEEKYLIQLKYQ